MSGSALLSSTENLDNLKSAVAAKYALPGCPALKI